MCWVGRQCRPPRGLDLEVSEKLQLQAAFDEFGTGLNPMGLFFWGWGQSAKTPWNVLEAKSVGKEFGWNILTRKNCWFHDGIILGEGLKAWSKEFQWLKHIETIVLRYARDRYRLCRGWSIWSNCVEICYGWIDSQNYYFWFSQTLPILMPI